MTKRIKTFFEITNGWSQDYLRLGLCLLILGLGVPGAVIAQSDGDDADEGSEPEKEELELLPDELAADERIRRQEQVLLAESAEKEADSLVEDQRYEKAVEQLKTAVRHYERAGETEGLTKRIERNENRIPQLYLQWAEDLAREAEMEAEEEKFDEARDKLQQAMEVAPEETDRMRSRFEEVDELIKQLRQESRIARETAEDEVMPDKAERAEDIEILLKNGKMLMEEDRLGDARDKFEEVLSNDPYNIEAISNLRKLNERLNEVGEDRRKVSRAEMMAESTWTWNQPVRRARVEDEEEVEGRAVRKERKEIEQKLEEIVIPELDFEEATIAQVIAYLKRKSQELDPEGKGVNFFLLGEEGGGSDDAQEVPDEEGDFDMDEDEEVAGIARKTITMSMDNMPLGQALRYICQGAGLTYHVEEHAVIIAPEGYTTREIKTRFYPVKAGIFTGQSDEEDDDGDDDDQWGFDEGGGGGSAPRVSKDEVQGYFEDKGVKFPDGASVSFDHRTSKLIVSNTEENLQQMEMILDELNVTPMQVTIQAKFVEINQDELEELGMRWAITNPLGTSGSDLQINPGGYVDQTGRQEIVPVYDDGSTTPPEEGAQPTGYQTVASPSVVGESLLRSGVRTAETALGSGTDLPQMSVNAVLGAIDVTAMLQAVEQAGSSDVLSAPRVTTMSGEQATMRIGTERYFPESWSAPELEVDDGDTVVTPSAPEFGDSTDLGVLLEVTPQVQSDGTTISMHIRPQVKTFHGYDTEHNTTTRQSGEELEFKYNMPIIGMRDVDTNIIIHDGETVVLGGLIKESKETFSDKIPFLGDLPMIGRIFQNKGESTEKNNLLIFINARLVSPSGQTKREVEDSGLPNFSR